MVLSFLITLRNPHLTLPNDLIIPFLYVPVWAIIHRLSLHFILRPLSKYVIQPPPISLEEKNKLRNRKTKERYSKSKPKKISEKLKFLISSWKVIQFSLVVILGCVVMFNNLDWFLDPKSWYIGYPNHHPFS